jgi:hypothetical protein
LFANGATNVTGWIWLVVCGQVIDFEDEMEALDAMSETGTWKVRSPSNPMWFSGG